MDGEQRDPKNTTKNLFVGLAAANEKKPSNPNGECDNQNNGKRRRVSFGRRITYFQAATSNTGSSSSYVRMVSPTPTPSPLPPDLFEDTHAIFDHFQQRPADATRTLREDSADGLHKSMQRENVLENISLPSQVLTLSLTQNDLQSVQQQQKGETENAFDSSLDSADEDEVVVRMEETSTEEDEYVVEDAEENNSDEMVAHMDSTGEVLASVEKEAENNNSDEMEEDSTGEMLATVQKEATDNISNEIIAQIEEALLEKEAADSNSSEIVTQMEEDLTHTRGLQPSVQVQQKETTSTEIDTSSIPEEVICQIEDDFAEALHEYVEKTKRFYELQNEKLQLLDQMKEQLRKLREENQAFWANLEDGIKEVLREVNNQRTRGPK